MNRFFTAIAAVLLFVGILAASINTAPQASAQDANSNNNTTCVDQTGYGCDPSNSTASDAGDYTCTAGEGDDCASDGYGNDTPTKGERTPQRYLDSDMTGVSSRAVKYTITVPSAGMLIIEGVKVHVAKSVVHGQRGVYAAMIGGHTYTVWITDGAWAITYNDNALTDFCTRYDNGAGLAQGRRFTPKSWGKNPCGITEHKKNVGQNSDATPDNSIDDCGNTNDCNNAVDGGTAGVTDSEAGGNTDNSGDSVMVTNDGGNSGDGNSIDDSTDNGGNNVSDGNDGGDNTGQRVPSGIGQDLDFQAHTPVVATDITLSDGRHFSECYMADPPLDGTLNTGVAYPNGDEIDAAPNGACDI